MEACGDGVAKKELEVALICAPKRHFAVLALSIELDTKPPFLERQVRWRVVATQFIPMEVPAVHQGVMNCGENIADPFGPDFRNIESIAGGDAGFLMPVVPKTTDILICTQLVYTGNIRS